MENGGEVTNIQSKITKLYISSPTIQGIKPSFRSIFGN